MNYNPSYTITDEDYLYPMGSQPMAWEYFVEYFQALPYPEDVIQDLYHHWYPQNNEGELFSCENTTPFCEQKAEDNNNDEVLNNLNNNVDDNIQVIELDTKQ